jgi:FAD:protein FMN transferase
MIRAHRAIGENGLLAVFPFFMLALLLLPLGLTGCGEASGPSLDSTSTSEGGLRLRGPTMGTSWSVSLHGIGPRADLQARLQAELDSIEAVLTTYRPDSELMLLNSAGLVEANDGFVVSETTWECLRIARDLARATDGAFDPTIQPLVALWGFGKERELPIPSDAQIETALAATGWQGYSLTLEPRSVQKNATIQLDLSAVAKGYAADCLAVLAADFDCTGGLIEVGGEIRVFGERTDGGPWKIGVEAPAVRPGAPRVIGSILKIDPNGRFQALATSGDSRNRRTVDGFSFSHILDPRTGRPVVNPPASVTVVAPSCAVADAWATALLVLGPEQGLPLAVQAGLEVCFQIRIADGSFRTIASDGYTALLAATPDD